ncbi:nicotinate (nicotinamide) nucleotide adenylyltransferase [Parapedobacter sp. 10938]|uniref:nicotinate (nicotinamide) nucleotide adenylyltransferase n=1 Tax=Parapedobacter flavus TaxID=3110225 RepID=UPI002DBDCBA3|nr:nicotinate (nicotinamide) nucleotide adenylyltransferase [Parapedobacter sp. 10938]MEC3881518.1 nicotinate (nicotinamide) nucleotide adenylyltransferase [Parapedobacter sp. 10938]
MQHIGLFFGSFNPIHTGHLIIANYMANYTELDEVWLIVTPHNPLKKKGSLINQYDRLEMVNLAIEKAENIRSSTIEFSLPQPSYTIDTLTHLREKYPEKTFVLIMGSDNLVSFHKWKNHEIILRHHRILVYPRPDYPAPAELAEHPAVTITDTPLMAFSSTFIRNAVKTGRNIRYFVPDSVEAFIENKGLYK